MAREVPTGPGATLSPVQVEVGNLRKISEAIAQSPGIRALQETSRAISQSAGIKALENFKGIQIPMPERPTRGMDESLLRAMAERNAAPLITRDASLAMLEAMRSTDRWARRTFWVATVGLLVSISAVVLSLLLS